MSNQLVSHAKPNYQTTTQYIPYPTQEEYNARQQEIIKISEDMQDINQIFSDLSTIVNTQAPDIENIDFNVTQANENTRQGVKYLEKAESYQRANPLTKILTILSTTVIGTAIGGPVGLVVGLKVGCIATAATGAVAGGYAGKFYHEKVYNKPTTSPALSTSSKPTSSTPIINKR